MTSEKLNIQAAPGCSQQAAQPCRTQAVAKPSLRAVIAGWRARAKQRDALARLDGWSLRDLGVSEAEVWNELRKPFWLE
jgi:uncharacterized protein YjiS (DUF1127 family)